MKETLIKLGTGLIAKLIRYALTGAGGTAIATSGPDGQALDVTQLAAGVSSVAVAIGWSLWEDYVKKRQALAQPFPAMPAQPQPTNPP
jgi:hypothetical protein